MKVKIANKIYGRDYTPEGNEQRLKLVGRVGHIIAEHNSHGLCYDVKVDNEIATYDPDELTFL